MIKKLIVKYLKNHPLDEQQLMSMAADILEPRLESISKDDIDNFLEQLSGIENASTFFSALMAADLKRYWKASTPLEQLNIRGMFARALYFKSSINKIKNRNSEIEPLPETNRRTTKSV